MIEVFSKELGSSFLLIDFLAGYDLLFHYNYLKKVHEAKASRIELGIVFLYRLFDFRLY